MKKKKTKKTFLRDKIKLPEKVLKMLKEQEKKDSKK
jgi:hypothetical protein